MNNKEYGTLGDLGKLIGGSSHDAGKALKKIGLRTPDGKPSRKAFDGDFCKQAPTNRGTGYFWVWHLERTCNALAEAHFAVNTKTES